MKKIILSVTLILTFLMSCNQSQNKQNNQSKGGDEMDTRVFKIYTNIEMKKVKFKNRYGIEIAGDLYLPENYTNQKNPAIVYLDHLEQLKNKLQDYMLKRWLLMVLLL